MRHDPMNGIYRHPTGRANTHLHCVSNLNVAGLVEAFRFSMTSQPGARSGVVPRSDYERIKGCG
jgi:hypothetical protein